MLPPQRPQLLGPGPGQQRDDDVGVQRVGSRQRQHASRLLQCQRLRDAARATVRHLAQLDHVPLHQVPSHRPTYRPVQACLDRAQATCRQRLGQRMQPTVHLHRRQVPQLARPQVGEHMRVAQELVLPARHRCGIELAELQPVLHRLADRVVRRPQGQTVLMSPGHLPQPTQRLRLGPASRPTHDPFAATVVPHRDRGDPPLPRLRPAQPPSPRARACRSLTPRRSHVPPRSQRAPPRGPTDADPP